MGPDDAARAATIASWSRAEDELYRPLMADPSLYEDVVRQVGGLVAWLREAAADDDALLAVFHRGDVPDGVVPGRVALAAACAIRHRELQGQAESARRLAVLATAREAGEAWATIEPRTLPGGIGSAGIRLIVHVHSGVGVGTDVDMDPESGAPVFVARPVAIDLATGALVAAPEWLGDEGRYATAAERDAKVTDLIDSTERFV
ncbi:MAG TPA: hypothetical protein VFA94_01980 [Acidimicrobiales bacterium]|nr:hypothetical protein [Acidimicrobiales bacterium]